MAKKRQTLLRETRPTPFWRLGLSVVVPFALGLLLVGSTFGEAPDATGGMGNSPPATDFDEPAQTSDASDAEDPEPETPEVAPTAEEEPESPELAVLPADVAMGTGATETPEVVEEVPEVVEEIPVVEETPEVEVAEAPVVIEAPNREPSNTRFVRGRLAYLRCGSMADADGRCPRDRDLETSAWTALEGANDCGLGEGSADVRLHFSGGAPELRFRDYGEPPLALGTLQACLAPRVAALRTTLPQSFVLSMRLTLR